MIFGRMNVIHSPLDSEPIIERVSKVFSFNWDKNLFESGFPRNWC